MDKIRTDEDNPGAYRRMHVYRIFNLNQLISLRFPSQFSHHPSSRLSQKVSCRLETKVDMLIQGRDNKLPRTIKEQIHHNLASSLSKTP